MHVNLVHIVLYDILLYAGNINNIIIDVLAGCVCWECILHLLFLYDFQSENNCTADVDLKITTPRCTCTAYACNTTATASRLRSSDYGKRSRYCDETHIVYRYVYVVSFSSLLYSTYIF